MPPTGAKFCHSITSTDFFTFYSRIHQTVLVELQQQPCDLGSKLSGLKRPQFSTYSNCSSHLDSTFHFNTNENEIWSSNINIFPRLFTTAVKRCSRPKFPNVARLRQRLPTPPKCVMALCLTRRCHPPVRVHQAQNSANWENPKQKNNTLAKQIFHQLYLNLTNFLFTFVFSRSKICTLTLNLSQDKCEIFLHNIFLGRSRHLSAGRASWRAVTPHPGLGGDLVQCPDMHGWLLAGKG